MAFSSTNLPAVYWDRGDPARALAAGPTVLEHARRAGFIIPLFVVPAFLADIYGGLGVVPRALSALAEADALQAPIAPMYQPTLRAVEIRVHLANGQVAEAMALAEQHAALLDTLPSFYVRGSLYYLLGVLTAIRCELSLLRGEPAQAIDIARQAEAEARRVARRPMPEILYWRARGHQAAGELGPARATLDRARGRAERIGQQRMLWPIVALQADLAAEAGEAAQAEALRAQARSIVTSIADHAGSPELRASFLARPAVRALLP